MLSTRGTPEKRASVLKLKNVLCSGDCSRLSECLFKANNGTYNMQNNRELR